MSSVPIACTLTPAGAARRVAEWSDFLSSAVEKVDQDRYQAVLTLKSDAEVLVAGTILAEREKACCSFFVFSVAVDRIGTRLLIEVPPEAEPVLVCLLDLLPPRLRRPGDAGPNR
jgi:hypothetical protein